MGYDLGLQIEAQAPESRLIGVHIGTCPYSEPIYRLDSTNLRLYLPLRREAIYTLSIVRPSVQDRGLHPAAQAGYLGFVSPQCMIKNGNMEE